MNILTEKYVIISVMGEHAGEIPAQIFSRKIVDIQLTGKTFWMIKSPKANPARTFELIREAKNQNKDGYCIFIEPATTGGARPTTVSMQATSYSRDKIHWESLPSKISPVTGKIDNNSYALVFDELRTLDDSINLDLWNYAEFGTDQPIVPKLGVSTICAVLKDMSNHPHRIKRNVRKVVAVARLSELACVWIR